MVSKLCPHCNKYYYSDTVQGLTEFFNWRNKKKQTLASYCKSCRSEMNKKTYENNKEIFLERNKDYYENNKEKFKGYYENNKEKKKKESHAWNVENKEKRVEYNKKYYDKNKVKMG